MDCYVCIPSLKDDPELMEQLRATFGSVTVHDGPDRPTKAELKTVAKNYHVAICGMAEEFDSDVAAAVERLNIIGSLSIGLDHLDIDALRAKDVDIVNINEANVTSVAEHTWMLILGLHKRLLESHRAVIDGTGRDGLSERPVDVAHRTLGIIGAGSIAYEVARMADAFGLETLIWTFNPDHHDEFETLESSFVADLAALIDQSDIVSIHIQLSEKTRNLLDADLVEQANMDRSRALINTSRSEIVADAIYNRISEGEVFDAAGLDVYPSNLPDEAGDRIYFTPHTAGITQEASRRMRDEVIRKIKDEIR